MKNTVFVLWLGLAVADIGWAQNEPYKNPDLSPRERAEDLLKRLTLKEKASLMINSSPAVERLGIKPYNWWSEALHGVARSGVATVYPITMGMASVFDDKAVEAVYTTVSDEARLNIIHAISVFLHVCSLANYFILQDRIIYNLNKHEKYCICFVVRVGRG